MDVIVDGADIVQVSRKKVPTPKGYENTDKFLAEMRKRYDEGVSFNLHNIIAGQEDARFVVGNQWDPVVERNRRNSHKPVLTFNRLVAFIAQIVGNRLLNETEIRVYPDKGGTKEVAAIREGLIRNIFKNSPADLARDEAQKYQVIGGQGNFQLCLDYAADDVFDQEIKLKPISAPYSVVFDPLSIDPTGGDAEWVFVSDEMPEDTFKARWPWADAVSFDSPQAYPWNQGGYWLTVDTIRVADYWRMVIDGVKILALLVDGSIRDVTDLSEDQYPFLDVPIATKPDGSYRIREVPNRFAQKYVCSGSQILEGPYNYPISSLPVYRVSGWEVNDGLKLHRWGVVRYLKDPQRLHNFWRSVIAEQLVSTPRNKWLVTKAMIEGYQEDWRDSPIKDDPFLYYNPDEGKPERVEPPQADAAVLEQAAATSQDMKDISNIHEASFGMPGNEVSGKAIQARQMTSDVGTFIYQDRQRMADERCARNINELIPYVYDTDRVVLVMGRDDKQVQQAINNGQNNDLGLGRYGITVSTGPASVTKRTLAAEQMTAFMNANPQAAGLVADLFAEALDWPMATQIADRLKKFLPPGAVPEDEMSPEQKMAQAQAQQEAANQQAMAQAQAEAEIAKTRSEAANNEAKANLAKAQSIQAIADAEARLKDVNSKVDEREMRALLDTVDQHNQITEDDRQFEAGREDARKENVND